MTLIENAARSLCRIHGDSEDDRATGAPRWMAYLPHVLAVIEALHDPNAAMREAGSEIIRHVGEDESDIGHQSDAGNVWRFMMDALHQDARQIQAEAADIMRVDE